MFDPFYSVLTYIASLECQLVVSIGCLTLHSIMSIDTCVYIMIAFKLLTYAIKCSSCACTIQWFFFNNTHVGFLMMWSR